MNFTFEKKLILFFSIICGGIIVAGISTYNKNKSTIETNNWVMHTHKVLYKSQQLLLSNMDVVNYTKEFLVHYDSFFIGPLLRSDSSAVRQLAKLKELTSDNPLEQTRIDSLNMLQVKQINFSNRIIQQRVGNDFVAGVEMGAVFQQMNQIDEIRALIEEIQETEKQLMKKRQEAYIKDIEAFNTSMFIFYSSIFLLLVIVFFKIRYNINIRKKAEENLRKSLIEVSEYKNELESQSLAINRSNAIAEFDLEGKILTANDNFLNLFGYSLSEIKGKHHSILLRNDQVKSTSYKEFWRHLNDGKFHRGEFERLRKDGQVIWIQGSYNPVHDSNGKLIKVMKMVTDITNQKRMYDNDFHIIR